MNAGSSHASTEIARIFVSVISALALTDGLATIAKVILVSLIFGRKQDQFGEGVAFLLALCQWVGAGK